MFPCHRQNKCQVEETAFLFSLSFVALFYVRNFKMFDLFSSQFLQFFFVLFFFPQYQIPFAILFRWFFIDSNTRSFSRTFVHLRLFINTKNPWCIPFGLCQMSKRILWEQMPPVEYICINHGPRYFCVYWASSKDEMFPHNMQKVLGLLILQCDTITEAVGNKLVCGVRNFRVIEAHETVGHINKTSVV